MRQVSLEAGDEVLIGEKPPLKKMATLQTRHQRPFTLTSVTSKGVATLRMEGKVKEMNVSRLRPYFIFERLDFSE